MTPLVSSNSSQQHMETLILCKYFLKGFCRYSVHFYYKRETTSSQSQELRNDVEPRPLH